MGILVSNFLKYQNNAKHFPDCRIKNSLCSKTKNWKLFFWNKVKDGHIDGCIIFTQRFSLSTS